ncbi:unnamed protein product, partial [Symbiodinium sp. CCMP2592]
SSSTRRSIRRRASRAPKTCRSKAVAEAEVVQVAGEAATEAAAEAQARDDLKEPSAIGMARKVLASSSQTAGTKI